MCVSTTRRLANTPILQQQLDCSQRKNFLFHYLKKDELQQFGFNQIGKQSFKKMVFQFELVAGAYGILWPAIVAVVK